MFAKNKNLLGGKIFYVTVIIFSIIELLMTAGCNNEKSFSFAVIADTQYADKDDRGNRSYRKSLTCLENCINELNKNKLKFAIQLGDIIDGGDNPETDLDTVLAVHNKLNTQKYHVLGNHDFWNISRQTVLSKLKMKNAYYDFTIDSWRFVVLDTMDIAVNGGWSPDSGNYLEGKELLDKLTARQAPNAFDWNGGIGQRQLLWLKNILQEAQKQKENVIVFGHLTLTPSEDVHNVWNYEEIIELLESYNCVKAYFCGHRHSGGYTFQNGIHYVTVEGMVEAPADNAYAIVKICTDRFEIDGFGKVPDRILSIDKQ